MLVEWLSKDQEHDAFDAWRNEVMLGDIPWQVEYPGGVNFSATHRILASTDLQIGQNILSGSKGCRSRRDIRASSFENYTCVVMTEGAQGIEQGHFNQKVNAGEIYLWDTERPCSFYAGEKLNQIEMSFPKEQVHKLNGGRKLEPNVISGVSGIGAILKQFMLAAMEHAGDFSGDHNDTVSSVGLRLMQSAFSESASVFPVSAKQKNLRRIQEYIKANLTDPGLCPAGVATANQISVRYLHLLFAHSPTTFSGYLNAERVALIEREIQGRSVNTHTLTELAFHCGFNSSAQLSRVFKRLRGVTPKEYRNSVWGS